MNDDSSIKIYGVLGYPVKHSFSPFMHNAAFNTLGIKAEYKVFEVKPEDLDDFLARIDANNIFGLNITVPYKEKILNFVHLDSESFYLRQIKAVNTIVKKDGIWKGFNTDIPGFSRHLKENFNPKDKKVAILGAGGAARAVVYVLAKSGAEEIAIFDIDKAKSQNVANMVKDFFKDFKIIPVENIEQLDIKNKDMLVNATPVGLKEDDPCLVKEEMLHKNIFVYELIYNPLETKLLALAKKLGAKTSNGLGMLLYQGVLSFKHFTDTDISVEKIFEIMRRALNIAINKL